MFFIFLGGVLLAVAFVLRASDPRFVPVFRVLSSVAFLAMLGGALSSAVVTIDSGELGVVRLFGKVEPIPLNPGIHFINPVADVVKLDATTHSYTMSGVHDEGAMSGDDAIRALTSDGLEVVIDCTLLYRIDPAEASRLLTEVGRSYEGKIVRPTARSHIRDATVYYQAVQLYTERRDEYQDRITKAITEDLARRGLIVESLLLRNITLPDSVRGSIEEKIQAEQDAQKMTFVLQKELQEAERKRVEAQGIADYQRIISLSLNDNQLRYEQIKAMKELALSPNAKVVITSGNTPLILDAK
jgi:regulator of protease activity HflC (stomatin/prohibitin superfamily)